MSEGINWYAGQRSRGRYLREEFLQCQSEPSLLLVSYRHLIVAGRCRFGVVGRGNPRSWSGFSG